MIRLLRSVLSVKDEFYHRHIVQYNLFAPVFDLFREKANRGVGNNLISSTILEVCSFLYLNIVHILPQLLVKTISQMYHLPFVIAYALHLFLL